MQIKDYKEFSENLQREMTFRIYGSSGKICYAFPALDGDYTEYERFGAVQELRPFIESGKITLVCVDTLGKDGLAGYSKDNRKRIETQEKWFHFVSEELYARVKIITGNDERAIVIGCDVGAFQASLLFFRRPDLYDTVISLSGVYDASCFFGNYMDDLVYDNSVMIFLKNMTYDHRYMQLYRRSKIVICSGRGCNETEYVASTKAFEELLKEKGIPAWVDYWGYDVMHDWYWWKKQLVYFMDKVV